MSWQTQGRKEHGRFGDGHAATSARTQQPRPAAPSLKPPHQPQPLQGAASATDLHERNVEDLTRVIASEANDPPLVEQTMVGQILMNRLRRTPLDWTVKQVWGAFAHKESPTDAQQALARNIIDGKEPNISKGATHFYSPPENAEKG